MAKDTATKLVGNMGRKGHLWHFLPKLIFYQQRSRVPWRSEFKRKTYGSSYGRYRDSAVFVFSVYSDLQTWSGKSDKTNPLFLKSMCSCPYNLASILPPGRIPGCFFFSKVQSVIDLTHSDTWGHISNNRNPVFLLPLLRHILMWVFSDAAT